MANVTRDARGVSYNEVELRRYIHEGKPYVPTALVVQVLQDLETIRREVYVDKALDRTNAVKKQEIDDMQWFIDLQRKVAFKE